MFQKLRSSGTDFGVRFLSKRGENVGTLVPLIDEIAIQMKVDTDFLHKGSANMDFRPISTINTIKSPNKRALNATQVFDVGKDDGKILHFQGKSRIRFLVGERSSNGH